MMNWQAEEVVMEEEEDMMNEPTREGPKLPMVSTGEEDEEDRV